MGSGPAAVPTIATPIGRMEAMIAMDDPRRPMYDEVFKRPTFIREHLDELDDLVRATLPRDACRRWARVLLTGCALPGRAQVFGHTPRRSCSSCSPPSTSENAGMYWMECRRLL